MPEAEGEPYGVLFFLRKRNTMPMIIETFLTYQQLLNKLVNDKDLIINDLVFAEAKLKECGYFNIIGGYKVPFTNLYQFFNFISVGWDIVIIILIQIF